MTRIALITGGSGLLGREVVHAFTRAGWRAVGTYHRQGTNTATEYLSLSDVNNIRYVLHAIKPDVVVHCAANRFPDQCAADPAKAQLVNVEASANLATLCSESKTFLLYISTDYVFSGFPGEAPYAPDAAPNPPNVYGQTKLDGERAVSKSAAQREREGECLAAVLRVPVLYGPTGEDGNGISAVNCLVDQIWKAQGKSSTDDDVIKMDDYAQRYPTNTEDVGRVCVDICTLYTSKRSTELPRVLQFSSEDRYTKWEMCHLFAKILAIQLEGMVPHRPTPEEERTVKRPYDCHLDTTVLKDIGIDVSTKDFETWWRGHLRA